MLSSIISTLEGADALYDKGSLLLQIKQKIKCALSLRMGNKLMCLLNTHIQKQNDHTKLADILWLNSKCTWNIPN